MKVIFHGDDFGLTSGVNQGIIRSFKEGILSSTSFIAGGEAAEEAVSLARENPGLDMGLHLVLCDEPPVLPPENLSSIIPHGSHFPSRVEILKRVLKREIDYREVEAEWHAQIEMLTDAEIPVTHLDGHQFIHLFPGLLPICLRIAEDHQIPFVRASIADLISLTAGCKRIIQWIFLISWIKTFVSRSLPSHIRSLPSAGFLGAGGRMKRGAVLKTADAYRRKQFSPVVEFVLHPGIGDDYTSHKYRHWGYDWKKDFELLTDRSLKKALDLRGIELTSFGKEL